CPFWLLTLDRNARALSTELGGYSGPFYATYSVDASYDGPVTAVMVAQSAQGTEQATAGATTWSKAASLARGVAFRMTADGRTACDRWRSSSAAAMSGGSASYGSKTTRRVSNGLGSFWWPGVEVSTRRRLACTSSTQESDSTRAC